MFRSLCDGLRVVVVIGGAFAVGTLAEIPLASAGPFDFRIELGTKSQAGPSHAPRRQPRERPTRASTPATPAPQPRASAARASASAPRPTTPLTNVPWVDNLPTAQFVLDTVRSNTPWDEASRERAALRSLSDYVTGQASLSKDVPALAHYRKAEYDRAAAGKGDEYYWSEQWHRAVLASFIEPNIASAYLSTPAWQAQLAPIRAHEAALKANIAASENRTKAAIAKTIEVTGKAKVDRSVFGISLGEPLALPACPEARSESNCIKTAAASARGGSPFAALTAGLESWVETTATTGGVTPPGMSQHIVILGKARCPNWVTCQVVVTTKDGYALAATFQTSLVRKLAGKDVLDDVARNLFAKYHVKPSADGESECRVNYQGVTLGTNGRASNWTWSPPGLSVHYTTFGNPTNCEQGRVDIQTSAYTALSDEISAQEQAAQPQL